jgi:hypothetical protein
VNYQRVLYNRYMDRIQNGFSSSCFM